MRFDLKRPAQSYAHKRTTLNSCRGFFLFGIKRNTTYVEERVLGLMQCLQTDSVN